MARKCELTGKKPMFGGSRKHQRGSSGGGGAWSFRAQRSLKKWNPNLRKVTVVEVNSGSQEKMKISMKAYKKLRKGHVLNGYKLV